jgi:ribonucleoside-diphosphate reductase beta chain
MAKKKSLLQERIVYKPFEYQEAYDYWLKQQQAHWLHTEVPMMSDLNDWKQNLNETERNIIGSILKGFAQTETVVNDYWSGLVTKWFRKPEVIMMATTFGAFETIHAEAYSLLNETLGLENFAEFMEDEATMAKIEALTSVRDSFNGGKDIHEIAKSLAIFSAFTEGVNLFSSFAVLLSFKMRNKLKGVGQIVEWSIRDESMHSEAGCWLFRTLVNEHPEVKTPELEAAINEAALLSLKLELDFISKVYELGDLEGCNKYDLEHFIKNRVNTKLADLGYRPIISDVDMTAVDRMKWFDHLSAGKQHTDFFANRVTNYSKGHMEWDAASIF